MSVMLVFLVTVSYAQETEQKEKTVDDIQKWTFVDEVGYGFPGEAMSLRFIFGASYSVNKNLYLRAQLGYICGFYSKYQNGSTLETDMGFITLPLEVGYKIVTENSFPWGIIPFAGIGFNLGVSAKAEYNKEEYELDGVKGKMGVEARAGLRLVLGGFVVTGSYYFPLNSKQENFFGEDAYPEISIGFGF